MTPARSSGDIPSTPGRGVRCRHCPVAEGLACQGLKARRLCNLIDPSHPDYQSGYRDTLTAHAREMAGRPQYPPLATQAKNLAASLWEWATSGFKMASDEEQARRREICAECPKWEAAARRCVLCGCATDYKVRMKTEHCPIDKW